MPWPIVHHVIHRWLHGYLNNYNDFNMKMRSINMIKPLFSNVRINTQDVKTDVGITISSV